MQSLWPPVTKKGRNDQIFLPFSSICLNNILNENRNIFKKSQGPASLQFIIQQSYMKYKSENGRSSVKSPQQLKCAVLNVHNKY